MPTTIIAHPEEDDDDEGRWQKAKEGEDEFDGGQYRWWQ